MSQDVGLVRPRITRPDVAAALSPPKTDSTAPPRPSDAKIRASEHVSLV
jgi:hypothetical protein